MKANAARIDYQILIDGDRGLTVEFDQSQSPMKEDRVTSLAALLEEKKIPGVQAILPNGNLLTVIYDPLVLTYGRLNRNLASLIRILASKEPMSDGQESDRQEKEGVPHEDH
ncbi:MAG: carboxyltransferase domain-containing protein [Eubacteriales bacterium]